MDIHACANLQPPSVPNNNQTLHREPVGHCSDQTDGEVHDLLLVHRSRRHRRATVALGSSDNHFLASIWTSECSMHQVPEGRLDCNRTTLAQVAPASGADFYVSGTLSAALRKEKYLLTWADHSA